MTRRTPSPDDPLRGAGDRHAPLFLLLLALLLYFLRFGYDYGISDQDDILPYLLHRFDPSLFNQDWFVLGQAATFGVRTYFIVLLQTIALVMPVWLAFLLVYVTIWLCLGGAVYRVGYLLTRNRVAASGAVVVALVLTPQWTLGGNDLVHSILVPSMLGWTLGLWGLVAFLRAHPIRAAVLIGLATWVQSLVGLQLAGLLGLLQLWTSSARSDSLRAFLLFVGVYVLAALPAVGPLVYQQLSATPPPDTSTSPSMFYIMAKFRIPHHYLFFSFPPRSLVRFGLLAASGGASFLYLSRSRRVYHRMFVTRCFVCILACCAGAFVFTEIIPALAIAQLQLFKMTVLAKVLLIVLICGALGSRLPGWFTTFYDRVWAARRTGLVAALGLWALVLGGGFFGSTFVHAKLRPLAHTQTPMAQVEQWAREQTSRDAVFAIPPSWSGFRSRAQRAIVINYKSFPYQPHRNAEWFERLLQLAPIALPDRSTPTLTDSLDAAYHQQSALALHRLAPRYGFDYVVRNRPFTAASASYVLVFSTGEWLVYRRVLLDSRSR